MKKKKYPDIKPQFLKNKTGKTVLVYLDYASYESIFDEISDLEKEIKQLKKVTQKKKR